MPTRDIIVIGASAGGISSLRNLVSHFPPNFPASVFVVVHQPAWHKSELPYLLTRAGNLPAEAPEQGQPIQHGRIYVAPPDRHLLLDRDRIHLWRGPKENTHRPSINALFRSAAVACGPRVIGVVLSGLLYDGATGLWWIKRHGGIAMAQDPDDALFPDMPRAAMQTVDLDYVAPAVQLGRQLVQIASHPGHISQQPPQEQL